MSEWEIKLLEDHSAACRVNHGQLHYFKTWRDAQIWLNQILIQLKKPGLKEIAPPICENCKYYKKAPFKIYYLQEGIQKSCGINDCDICELKEGPCTFNYTDCKGPFLIGEK